MKKLLMLCLFLLALTGCKIDCSDPASVPSKVTAVVVSQWACQNPAAVQADLATVASKYGLCTEGGQMKGPIASVVCPILVKGLQSLAADQVPPGWQCDPSKVGSGFAAGLTLLCMQIPF